MATDFYTKVHTNPIIAAVNDLDKLDLAIKSPCEPLVARGLIKDKEDVINSLKFGAIAISTSKENIWYM